MHHDHINARKTLRPAQAHDSPSRNQLHAPERGTTGAMAEAWVLGAPSFQFPEPMIESKGTPLKLSCDHGLDCAKKCENNNNNNNNNFRAQDASRALKIPQQFFWRQQGGSLHLTDITQSRS